MIRHVYCCDWCNDQQDYYADSIHDALPGELQCHCGRPAYKVYGCNIATIDPINREELTGKPGPDITSIGERDRVLKQENLTMDTMSNPKIPRREWKHKITKENLVTEMLRKQNEN